MKHSENFLRITQDARTRILETHIDDLHARIEKGDNGYVLIDTREDHEWTRGHIPGAVHLGRGILERDIETLVPDHDAEIIVYCGGGYRSALAAESLQRMGYGRVYSLFEGWSGWRKQGWPLDP